MTSNPNDITMSLKLTLEEMYSGVIKKIQYQRNQPCSSCNKSSDCSACSGKEIALSEIIEEIKIPEGVDEGMTLQFKNRGHFYYEKKKLWELFSKNKNGFGSLILNVEAIKHDLFYREGSDLIYPCRIEQSDLEKGNQIIEVQLLNKETLKIQIPPNITDRKILRIKGKGFKDIATNQKGNLLIVIDVVNEYV